jgi:hypothetical protein
MVRVVVRVRVRETDHVTIKVVSRPTIVSCKYNERVVEDACAFQRGHYITYACSGVGGRHQCSAKGLGLAMGRHCITPPTHG